ncbi:MAG: TlyA family RNA methyltransferase [Ruminococcus sp.]|nr:TlyA family RNA methyltransferase [Ruminococcus sp.]
MKERLDIRLVKDDLAKSRERAKELIKKGAVTVNGAVVNKASALVDESDVIEAEEDLAYVGRGALKLEKALDCFKVSPEGLVCADIGASTGGFTEIMLLRGAKKVYAVDVGHSQLAESLCADPRVVNMEGCNARYLTPESFSEPIQFISMDLSFISLTKVMGAVASCAAEGADIIALIKPQFEAGKSALNKQGVVSSRKAHIEVLKGLLSFFSGCGFAVKQLTFSPVRGGSGNIEYLVHLCKGDEPDNVFDIKSLVDTAFESL